MPLEINPITGKLTAVHDNGSAHNDGTKIIEIAGATEVVEHSDKELPLLFIDIKCLFTQYRPVLADRFGVETVFVAAGIGKTEPYYYSPKLWDWLEQRFDIWLLIRPISWINTVELKKVIDTIPSLDGIHTFHDLPDALMDILDYLNEFRRVGYPKRPFVYVGMYRTEFVADFITKPREEGIATKGIFTGFSEGITHEDIKVLSDFYSDEYLKDDDFYDVNFDGWGADWYGSY